MLAPSSHANYFFCCSRAERQPTLLKSGVQARHFSMPSHYVRSMAKPTGSKVENSTPHYVQASVKPAAAWQKNSYKNGIAKVLRQATAQKPPKDSNHKHSPNTQKPSFMLLLLLVCRTCRKGWSLSIFCCILFFITFKF